jgi:GDP-L-fucose synthase
MRFNKGSKIFIAGHNGLVGSAIFRYFKKKGYKNIFIRNHNLLNLKNQSATHKYLKTIKPDVVIIAAAKVGGILANQKYKAQFIYDNLMIQANLIHGSYLSGVKKLIFLGSSCIYPKFSRQPIN